MTDETKQSFADELFSDGERASWGRVGSFIALVTVLIWCSILLAHVHKFEDLKALGDFLKSCTWVIAVLYGISKISDTLALFTGGQK